MSHQAQPTVVGVANFNAAEDAAALLGAMKSSGTDEQAVIVILTSRSNAQRQAIAQAFKCEYGRDIIMDLKSELGDHFENVIDALMRPPAEYLCKELHDCMEGEWPFEHTLDLSLVEILCTRTNKEIAEIVETYERLYNRPLAEHIESKIEDNVNELLVLIVKGERDEEAAVDPERAGYDASDLFCAWHDCKWGIDVGFYFEVLGRQSFAQLRVVFEQYKEMAGHAIEDTIKDKFEEDQYAYGAIVDIAQNSAAWFATRLRAAMRGRLGNDDRALVRMVVSRSELDLRTIAAEYERLYDKTLASEIRGETSEGYKRVLAALIGPA